MLTLAGDDEDTRVESFEAIKDQLAAPGLEVKLGGQVPLFQDINEQVAKDIGRAEYVGITDDEALAAFHRLCRTEGMIPALESSHAVAYAMKLAATMRPDQHLLVNLSGRGDKDIGTVAELSGMKGLS